MLRRSAAIPVLVVTAMPVTSCNAILGNGDKILASDAGTLDEMASADGSADMASADLWIGASDGDDVANPDATDDPESESSADAAEGGADVAGEATSDAGCDASVCSGNCVDLTADGANCGACGYACVHGRQCVAGRCTPAWRGMTTANAPTARSGPGAAIGGQLIIAGGFVSCSPSLGTAAAYDPNSNTWSGLPNLNSPRSQHTVVSSGSYIYAFGGLSDCSMGTTQLGTLEQWKPGDTSWTVVNGSNPPAARYAHESIWTGSKLFIYGGSSGSQPYVASGAVYDPVANAWSDASCPLMGCMRNGAPTILEQAYVRLWGGGGGNAPGLQYEIATGVWSPWTPPATFPTALGNPADDGRRIYFPSGGGAGNLDIVIFDRQTQMQAIDTVTSPANLSTGGAIAWTGTEVVLWSGPGSGGPTTAGGRYQPPAPQ
jgi:predicted small secreted protein